MAAMGGGRQPVLILNPSAKRDSGRRAQLSNINAGKAIASMTDGSLASDGVFRYRSKYSWTEGDVEDAPRSHGRHRPHQ